MQNKVFPWLLLYVRLLQLARIWVACPCLGQNFATKAIGVLIPWEGARILWPMREHLDGHSSQASVHTLIREYYQNILKGVLSGPHASTTHVAPKGLASLCRIRFLQVFSVAGESRCTLKIEGVAPSFSQEEGSVIGKSALFWGEECRCYTAPCRATLGH